MTGTVLSGAILFLFVLSSAGAFGTGNADKVLIIKNERRLVLLSKGEMLKSYPVSLGRTPGTKVRRGDGKTPEGRYLIDRRNPASRFYKALHISYPNPSDIRDAKAAGVPPGGQIMIHGLPKDFEDLGSSHACLNWTRGCIAVSNAEMDEIWRLVPDGTPVEITP